MNIGISSIGIDGICGLVVAALLQNQITSIVGLKECIENNGNTCLKCFQQVSLIWKNTCKISFVGWDLCNPSEEIYPETKIVCTEKRFI